MRGLNAPPRSAVAPASLTPAAMSSSWLRLSTEQGPAMIPSRRPPMQHSLPTATSCVCCQLSVVGCLPTLRTRAGRLRRRRRLSAMLRPPSKTWFPSPPDRTHSISGQPVAVITPGPESNERIQRLINLTTYYTLFVVRSSIPSRLLGTTAEILGPSRRIDLWAATRPACRADSPAVG